MTVNDRIIGSDPDGNPVYEREDFDGDGPCTFRWSLGHQPPYGPLPPYPLPPQMRSREQ